MVTISEKHRVVGVTATPSMRIAFPQARIVKLNDADLILLPHAVPETIALRGLGVEVPAPILSQYHWPAPKHEPPFRVQKLTAALLSSHQRAYCLNELGTGKTRATLWAYDYLRSNGLAHKALIIAPLSTLDNVWRKEIFHILPELSVGVLHGTKQKRLQTLESEHDIFVINPAGLEVLKPELMARADIDVMIIDELATFRNAQGIRNKICRALSSKRKWVWGLTGSPTPNEPTDAWGQCKIVTPHSVPTFYSRFREEVMFRQSQFKWLPKKDSLDVVHKAMQPSVRYTLDDVTELPDIVERVIDVPLGYNQSHVYEQIRKNYYHVIQNQEITAVNAGTVLNKLLQISLGYVYTSTRGIVTLDNQSRLDVLCDLVDASSRKLICFIPYTHALEGVVEHFKKNGVDVAKVHGETPKRERDNIFNLFQSTDKYKVIAAHPSCMSHGLTLTAADTIVWFGPTPSLETFEQANARIRRVGQNHKQLILMLQSTTAEKRIYARLRAKQKVQDNLLDLFAEQTGG